MRVRESVSMKKEKGKRDEALQLNKNAGFSLVELLIAVIILAIIVVPMLRLFVSSARINGKARQSQRATTVAQDIMEGLKAYNIKELQAQFNNPMDGFYVMDSRLILGSIEEDKAREQADSDYRGDPDAPGIYYFTLEGVQIQGTAYDALIRVDARAYEEDKLADSGHRNAFNDVNMASPGSVMENKDGNFTETYAYKQAVLQDIDAGFAALPSQSDWNDKVIAAGGVDADGNPDFTFQVFKNMGGTVKRTITLNLKEGTPDADGNRTLDADVTFAYECTLGSDSYTTCGNLSAGYWLDLSPCGSGINSGNFYLFYYPLYEAAEEKIIINNDAKQPIRMYIVKQVDGDPATQLSDHQLNVAELGYRVSVEMNNASPTALDDTRIRTNLGMNLVNASYLGGTGTPAPGKLPTFEVEKTDIPTQAVYKLNSAVEPNMNIFGLSGIRLSGGAGAGADNEITEVIFDIEISVYKEGAKADGFLPEERMVVIEGSKNN